MSAPDALVDVLRDGRVHSGAELAAACGVSRAAVVRRVKCLRAAGWPIGARRGAGYHMAAAVAPLDRAAIERELAPVRERVADLAVLPEIASTNARLAQCPAPADGRLLLCIADHQSAGRGRRGRVWHTPPGSAVTLSAARRFAGAPAALAPLGLIVGVAVADVLRDAGLLDVALKWPNDVQVAGRKLGGILVEVGGDAAGPARATVGVGLNHDLRGTTRAFDQPVTDLRTCLDDPPDRSRLAGRLMARLVAAFDEFERAGPDALLQRWRGLDALAGQAVRVETGHGPVTGVAAGIDADGALVVRTDAGSRRFLAGEVSLRALP